MSMDIDDLEAQMSASVDVGGDLGQGQETALDVALDGKPHELQLRVMRVVSARKLDANDPALDLLNAAGVAADAAAVIETAAREVGEGVGKIQGQILAGAIKAGHSVKGDIAAVIKIGGDAILASINEAAQAGSDKIKEGSKGLIEKLDKAVEVKKKEGVSEFALAASEAATAAAGAASARVISESKVKLRYSLLTMSVIFLLYTGLGAFMGYEYLNLKDRIAPAPMVLNAAGKANCGVIPAPGGGEEKVCQIR